MIIPIYFTPWVNLLNSHFHRNTGMVPGLFNAHYFV